MNVERHKRAFNNILQRCWVIVAICTAAFYPCEAQHTNPKTLNSCQPVIEVAHSSISCFDLKNSNNVQFPTVEASCGGAIIGLSHQDTYYELASSRAPGFAGYFDLSRWEKISGDGGVDVTGAPNCILVEGANIANVHVAPQMETILRIVIPAEGYVAFDWKNIGGSNLLMEAIVNSKVYAVKMKGFYRSPMLKVGDTLSIRFQSNAMLNVQLSKFDFYTNAIAVTDRRWTATQEKANTFSFSQFITIERPALANIVFPSNLDGKNAANIASGASTTPAATGFPMLDEDGNLNTLQDQRVLDKDDCGFNVRWEDKVTIEAKGYVIQRVWKIEDIYNGNVVEHAQQIHAQGIINSATPNNDVNTTTTRSNKTIKNATNKSISYLETIPKYENGEALVAVH